MRSSQEAESTPPKACPLGERHPTGSPTALGGPDIREASTLAGRSPENSLVGTSNWRWLQGKDCKGLRSSSTPTWDLSTKG